MIIFDKDNANTSSGYANELLEKGRYPAKIAKTAIKTSKAGNKYLSIGFEIKLNDKTYYVWDIMNDNEKEFTIKKNSCFINALPNNIQNHATFTLEDLAKIIMNKALIINVDVEDQKEYGKRNVINVWDMPYSKIADNVQSEPDGADKDVPFFDSEEDAKKENPYGADEY